MASNGDSPLPEKRLTPDPVMDTISPYGSTVQNVGDVEPGNIEDEDGPPLSFADLGIPTGPQLKSTVAGKIRKIVDIDKKEIVFVVIAGIAIIATIIFTVYKLVTVNKKETDFVFALVLLVNSAFCIFYLFHGVLKERPYEIFILVAVTLVIILYLIINYTEGKHGTVKLIRLIVACAFCPVVIVLGLWIGGIYRQSGNLVFRTVGASSVLQGICRRMFLFLDLLKLDLQLGITMVILIMVNGVNIKELDIVILIVGFIITIAWFVLGHLAVRYENKIMTYIFWFVSPLELAYIIYKVVKASHRLEIAPALAACSLTAGIIAALVRISVIILTYFVYRNFDQGLKQKAFGIQ